MTGPDAPYLPCAPDGVDYLGRWRQASLTDPARRLPAEKDLHFWREHAAVYDDRGGQPAPATLTKLLQIIRPGATVLDIGCGTGRFAIELARRGRQVTGLDHSPDMLTRASTTAEDDLPLTWIHASWPATLDHRYDTALAAWSLYRQTDLARALTAMTDCADRIITVDIVGRPSDLVATAALILDRPVPKPEPRAALMCGAMIQIGLSARIDVIPEARRRSFTDLLHDLSWDLGPDEKSALAAGLADLAIDDGWYRETRAVGIVVGSALPRS